jgi:hypothetical protein
MTSMTRTTTPQAHPAVVGRAPSDILRNILAFEAGLSALRAAYPGLRHERVGTRMEWFLRASRPLAGKDLDLRGDLVIDTPCDEDTSEILDAMAHANDLTLGRAALDAAIADELGFLTGKLDYAIGCLHRGALQDLQARGLDRKAYLRNLEGRIAGKVIELFPEGSDLPGSRYRPGQHVRDTLKAATGAARKEAVRKEAVRAPRKERVREEPRREAKPARARTASARRESRPRPIRRRMYSALYE